MTNGEQDETYSDEIYRYYRFNQTVEVMRKLGIVIQNHEDEYALGNTSVAPDNLVSEDQRKRMDLCNISYEMVPLSECWIKIRSNVFYRWNLSDFVSISGKAIKAGQRIIWNSNGNTMLYGAMYIEARSTSESITFTLPIGVELDSMVPGRRVIVSWQDVTAVVRGTDFIDFNNNVLILSREDSHSTIPSVKS